MSIVLPFTSGNILDASVNKLVNACIEELILTQKVELYKSKRGDYISRSFSIRASFIEKLYDLKKKYRISIYMLVNIAIKNSIEDFENETGNIILKN